MSFRNYKDLIEYGDTVIVYMGYDNMLQFRVERRKVHQTKFGAIKHDDLVGVRFCTKIACTRGYVYALHPTPELWTINLPHRTQILYSTDISMIITQLELKPGSIVVEAGTGSGSLSHAILRTIVPNGRLHTFDFHAQRVQTARDEFVAHGFSDSEVSVALRDVCSDGFGVADSTVDAVFLDLPSPWLAIPFAAKALVAGGRICSFSPCMEQVQRACAAMTEAHFTDITTLECLQRTLDVRTVVLPVADLGYGPGKAVGNGADASDVKPATGHVELGGIGIQNDARPKKARYSENTGNTDYIAAEDGNASGQGDDRRSHIKPPWIQLPQPKASYVFKSAMPPLQMNGHTGFLTFATLYAH